MWYEKVGEINLETINMFSAFSKNQGKEILHPGLSNLVLLLFIRTMTFFCFSAIAEGDIAMGVITMNGFL